MKLMHIVEDQDRNSEIRVAAESLEDDGWTVHVEFGGGMVTRFHAWKTGVALVTFNRGDHGDGYLVTGTGRGRFDNIQEALAALHGMTTGPGLPTDPVMRRKQVLMNPSRVVGLETATSIDRVNAAVADPRLFDQLALTPKERIAAFRKSPALRKMASPSDMEAINLAIVRSDPRRLADIRDPSEQVRLAAVKKDGRVIEYIGNPSEAVQLAAVRKYGHAIRLIRNPSEAVRLAAVQQDDKP